MPRLSELLGTTVLKADDCIGEEVKQKTSQLQNGQVLSAPPRVPTSSAAGAWHSAHPACGHSGAQQQSGRRAAAGPLVLHFCCALGGCDSIPWHPPALSWARPAQSLCAQILILENVRFHKEETKNDPEFSKQVPATLRCAAPSFPARRPGLLPVAVRAG